MAMKESPETPAKMYALATVMTVIAIAPVLFRFKVRVMYNQKLGTDDWLMVPALLGTIGTAVAMYYATVRGGLGLHTPILPDGAPDYTESTELFLKASFVTLLTQVITLGATKLSVLFFYKRLFRGRIFTFTFWTMFTLTTIWTVSFFFANLLECLPLPLNWAGSGYSGSCINEPAMYLGEAFSDVLLDVMILTIPIPIVWKLQLRPTQKISLSGIFLLGAVVICASILRLVAYWDVIETQDNNGMADLTWLLAPTFYWPLIESSLGILGACLPSFRPAFKGMSPESVIRSVRSAFSLHSVRRKHSQSESVVAQDFIEKRSASNHSELTDSETVYTKGNMYDQYNGV